MSVGASGFVGFTIGGFFGFFAADQLHRWSSTLASTATASTTPALPAGFSDVNTYNSLAVDARPTWKSFAWQGGLAALSFIAGGMVKPSWAKLLLVGAGTGAVIHMAWQGVNHYIMIPLFGTSAWGMRAYAHEIQANNAIYPATTTPAATTTPPATGTAGLGAPPVRQLAAPPVRVLPAGQPARMPTPIAAAARSGFSPAPVRSAAPSAGPQGRLGQNGSSFTPPAGMAQVANLPNGNCPPGSTTIVNPDNLDMPFCVVPQLATPTAPSAPPPPVSMAPPPAPPSPPPSFMAPPPASPMPPPSAGPPAFTSPPAPPSPLPCNPCGSAQVGSQLSAASSALSVSATPLPVSSGGAAPCCGSSPCSCGGSSQMGALPPAQGPRHPMFSNMLGAAATRRARFAA